MGVDFCNQDGNGMGVPCPKPALLPFLITECRALGRKFNHVALTLL